MFFNWNDLIDLNFEMRIMFWVFEFIEYDVMLIVWVDCFVIFILYLFILFI